MKSPTSFKYGGRSISNSGTQDHSSFSPNQYMSSDLSLDFRGSLDLSLDFSLELLSFDFGIYPPNYSPEINIL